MKARLIFLFILSLFQLITAQENNSVQWGLHPSFGMTYTNQSQSLNNAENLELLLSIQANFNYFSENFQFDSDIFIQYGQIVAARMHPQKH